MRISCLPMAALMVGLAACTDGGPNGSGSVDLTLRETSQIMTRVAGGYLASVTGGAGAAVEPDTVASLVVQVTAIQALPASESENEDQDGAWVTIELEQSVEFDLTTLPAEGDDPIVFASGALAAGDYVNLRLFLENVTITFTGPLTVGPVTFDADTQYDVTIPSGDQTGIKTDAAFTVTGDGTDVHLLFSATATFLNVTTTGIGSVILAPVIRGGAAGS